MSTDAIASPEVKTDPQIVSIIVDTLKTRSAEAWGISPRTYRRYLRGEVPEQWEALIENPELALAVLRAALRLDAYARDGSVDPLEP